MQENPIQETALPEDNNLKSISQRPEPRQNKELRMIFTPEAFKDIRSSVGSERPETGGILLGFRTDYVVRQFIFDRKGRSSPGGYDPDVDYLNPLLKKAWEDNKYELIGFAHSHPRGLARLSGDWGNGIGDLGYLKTIFEQIKEIDKFLVPIIYSSYDGCPFKMIPFMAWRDAVEQYEEGRVAIIKPKPRSRAKTKEVSCKQTDCTAQST